MNIFHSITELFCEILWRHSSWAWFITTITQFFLHSFPLISNFLVYFISQLINWLDKHFILNFKHDGNGNKVKLRVGKFIFVIQMKNICFLPSTHTRSVCPFINGNANFIKNCSASNEKGCCWCLFSLFSEKLKLNLFSGYEKFWLLKFKGKFFFKFLQCQFFSPCVIDSWQWKHKKRKQQKFSLPLYEMTCTSFSKFPTFALIPFFSLISLVDIVAIRQYLLLTTSSSCFFFFFSLA